MAVKSLQCPSCGANIELDDSREFGFCSYCGSRVQIGERVNVNVKVTHEYKNAPQQNVTHIHNQYIIHNAAAEQNSPKSRLAALILCVILGIFGVHHFYVGRVGMGVLFFLTVGLVGIGWLIDIVLILIGSYRDRDGLKLTEW